MCQEFKLSARSYPTQNTAIAVKDNGHFHVREEAGACPGGEERIPRRGGPCGTGMPRRVQAGGWHDMICIVKKSLWCQHESQTRGR